MKRCCVASRPDRGPSCGVPVSRSVLPMSFRTLGFLVLPLAVALLAAGTGEAKVTAHQTCRKGFVLKRHSGHTRCLRRATSTAAGIASSPRPGMISPVVATTAR